MRKRGRVVEIVGVAGSGKSTLSRHFLRASQACWMDPWLVTRDPRNWGYMLRHALPCLCMALRPPFEGRWFTWTEVKGLLYLGGWDRILEQAAEDGARVAIVDQGAVFCLAALREFGPPRMMAAPFRGWWNRTLERWAVSLDVVLWLDAPDHVLIDRIRRRPQEHIVRDGSDEDISHFLARFRSAYEWVISEMTSRNGKLRVIRRDSSLLDDECLSAELWPLVERSTTVSA